MKGKVIVFEDKDGWGKSYLQYLTSYDDYLMDESLSGDHVERLTSPTNTLAESYVNNDTNITLILDTTDSSLGESIPEGYSVPHIIITTILVSVIMFVIVFGNLLVVLAIYTDKTLKTVQNSFIACLAVADALLGLVVMPFSLANEMMGYWYFGSVWCDLWKVIDVLLCTASILSICLISLDRYWSITRAVTYSRQRTPKRAALMIAAVWFLSAIICVPPLIGWKNPLPVSEYPLCILSDEIGYVFYSTFGSFYIPCIIMVFVYFKIYQAATRLARKNIRKKEKPAKVSHKVKDDDKPANASNENGNCNKEGVHSDDTSSDDKMSPAKDGEDNEPCPKGSVGNNAPPISHNNESVKFERVKVDNVDIVNEESVNHSDNNAQVDNSNSKKCENSRSDSETNKDSPETSRRESDKHKESSIRLPGVKKSRSSSNKSNKGGWRTASLRDHERHKRRLAKARERRATIVLGLVMAAFILCWFPFFTLYIITSFCKCIGNVVFTVVFWAGYCNSALNPIIYTVFNRDFRHAFQRIIFGRCKSRY